jgi:uncharacterized protein DUF5681
MATDSDDNDGRVGYKRPPKHSKFKPGRSGNPRGGRKPIRNLKADFLEELSEVIRVRDGDHEIKVTKQRAFVKSLIAAAIDGDVRATTALVSFCIRAFGQEQGDEQTPPTPDDVEILAKFVDREVRRRATGDGPNNDSQPEAVERSSDDGQ